MAGLAEALHFECVPIILSPSMQPPFSATLDWSRFSLRLEPSTANLRGLKRTLKVRSPTLHRSEWTVSACTYVHIMQRWWPTELGMVHHHASLALPR